MQRDSMVITYEPPDVPDEDACRRDRMTCLSPSNRSLHRGMAWLMRNESRWLVDVLARRNFLPLGRHIEQLPTEVWPVDEWNSDRELRADLVLRLWGRRIPETASPRMDEVRDAIGLLGVFQAHPNRESEEQLMQFAWAYRGVVGPDVRIAVLCLDEKVAQWVRDLMLRHPSKPPHIVLTPRMIRRSNSNLLDPVASPRRVLLEAMLHARTQRSLKLLTNAMRALRQFRGNEYVIHLEMLKSWMGKPLLLEASRKLEADVELEGPRDLAYELTASERESFLYVRGERAGREQGREEGRATALLDLLQDRGFDPDPEVGARILGCRDSARLRAWLARAAAITRLDELFE